MLNVGCGEMLSDFGLLNLQPTLITGLDVAEKPNGWLEEVAKKIRREKISFPSDYAKRIEYVCYDSVKFPFGDESYDTIFSWSAFEHVQDIKSVLREMHRVLKPDGKVFVQVYPWFYSRYGSHLTDWIHEPFFHVTQSEEWVKSRLDQFVSTSGRTDGFIDVYMYSEYKNLNRISPSLLYKVARECGFVIAKARIISHDEDLSQAPAGVEFADLMIAGTMMLMHKV